MSHIASLRFSAPSAVFCSTLTAEDTEERRERSDFEFGLKALMPPTREGRANDQPSPNFISFLQETNLSSDGNYEYHRLSAKRSLMGMSKMN
jgi:hypothetical protein